MYILYICIYIYTHTHIYMYIHSYFFSICTLSHILCVYIQGCQLATSDGYNIGKFDQVDYSIDPDSNDVVITYSGGDGGRCVQL